MAHAMACDDESLVDYFIIATKGFDGSAAQLAFVYPPVDDDHDETDFCENVAMFTFPHGYVHSWDGRSLPPPPAHNLFMLTDAQGDHLYGASLSFFETANHVKSLCLLARRPFYTQLLRYLEQLLLLGLHQARRCTSAGGDAVEKALCNLFHEVPVPYRGLSVQMQIGELEIVLERPPFLDFPFDVDAELMLYAFMMIDPKTLQQLYHHVLLEHRVLIVGNDSVLVTAVVETLKGLIFPLTWLHVVIPNIPDSLDLSTLLDAPVPFLAGAHTGQLQHVAIPSNVVKYDLTESRLIVPSGHNNSYQHQYQQDLESVVLPPLPEASTRLLQKLSTTRVADLHTQKKELHQKLWDRRIQLQKCCMATSTAKGSSTTSTRAPVISPKNFFLVKQSLVYKKMMKLYLEVATSILQDFASSMSHQTKQFEPEKFVEKKPLPVRPFFKALTETAQFQSFMGQHNDYTAGVLPLEEAAKFQFVHKTLLSSEHLTGNQADASLAVAMALTKTFVAHAPLVSEPNPASDGSSEPEIKSRLEVIFPAVNLEAFGEPREILFPTMATDVVHSSLGTFLSPSGVASRRASKDTSDWMQSFMRTVPLPSALVRSELLTSSSSGNNNDHTSHSSSSSSLLSIFGASSAAPPNSTMGLPPPAPFKRSRTIDRLKKATPFYRTMTQKALDSTLSSLASAAAGMATNATAPPPAPTRPTTVVRSIWLITTSACACRDRIVLLTQRLVEQLTIHGTKTAPFVTTAYCELIHALATCGHPSEAKAVFEECLSGSALLSLAPIASLPHFWKPFSALLRCYITNGLVQRAFDLLAQVQIDEEQLLDPSLGVLAFSAHVLSAATESVVERSFVTFSCGNLGMRLAPRSTTDNAASLSTCGSSSPGSSSSSASPPSGMGCELIAFQNTPDATRDESTANRPTLADTSGLRVHDVLETINGEFVLHRPFHEIITALKQASRPMTVTFVRGLDRVDALLGDATDGSGARRTSASSTSAVVDGRVGHATVSSSSSKSTPRRDLCDRFGLLPARGIRITPLADCESCGTRLHLTQVQSGWSPTDANDYMTRCHACSHRFVPRLCVMLGVMTTLYQPAAQLPHDATVEQLEYLSMAVIRKELSNLAQKLPLPLLAMKDLRERNPRIYWNMVVKLLSLDLPLDFLDLPDATRDAVPSQPQGGKATAAVDTKATADDDEMRQLRDMVLKRAQRVAREHPAQRMDDIVASVLTSLEQQTKATLQVNKPKATKDVPGRKRWSLLGSMHTSSSLNLRTPPAASSTSSTNKGTTTASTIVRSQSNDQDHDDDDDRRRSSFDDERETDVEDMRSSRTISVTDSTVSDDPLSFSATDTNAASTTHPKPPTRGAKFMQSLPSAPFQRSTRALPSAR